MAMASNNQQNDESSVSESWMDYSIRMHLRHNSGSVNYEDESSACVVMGLPPSIPTIPTAPTASFEDPPSLGPSLAPSLPPPLAPPHEPPPPPPLHATPYQEMEVDFPMDIAVAKLVNDHIIPPGEGEDVDELYQNLHFQVSNQRKHGDGNGNENGNEQRTENNTNNLHLQQTSSEEQNYNRFRCSTTNNDNSENSATSSSDEPEPNYNTESSASTLADANERENYNDQTDEFIDQCQIIITNTTSDTIGTTESQPPSPVPSLTPSSFSSSSSNSSSNSSSISISDSNDQNRTNQDNNRRQEVRKERTSVFQCFGRKGHKRTSSVSVFIVPRVSLPYTIEHNRSTKQWTAVINTDQDELDCGGSVTTYDNDGIIAITYNSEQKAREACYAYTPPRMHPFEDYVNCHICKKKFHKVIRRPNNCQNCGTCVCSNCSTTWPSSMIPFTYQMRNKRKKNNVKVCYACDWLNETFQSSLVDGDYDQAEALYATGNVNLRCPFAKDKNDIR
jgi:hypothetical protein